MRAFFQKFETFGLGQTNWAEILWGIWGISGQTISTILALWVPCPWESVAGSLSYKKLWFLGLKHTTPKYSQNKIWAVKNLGNNVCTSVFGDREPTKLGLSIFDNWNIRSTSYFVKNLSNFISQSLKRYNKYCHNLRSLFLLDFQNMPPMFSWIFLKFSICL